MAEKSKFDDVPGQLKQPEVVGEEQTGLKSTTGSESLDKLVQDMSMALVMKPAITMLEIFLPEYVTDEINNYLDEKRKILPSFANELVGQIKAHDDSAQLDMDIKNDGPPKGLATLCEGFVKTYLQTQGISEAKSKCISMWSVHSYEGDYNPIHDHGLKTMMGMSMILYLKVPPQIEKLPGSVKDFEGGSHKVALNNATGMTDGFTFFSWGANHGSQDIRMGKLVTESFVKPEVGKLLMFPNWLKHAVSPFYGEGERRSLSANFEIETTQASIVNDQKHYIIGGPLKNNQTASKEI